MKTQPDITAILKSGRIQSELELERALIADRKLRTLARKDQKYVVIRKKLRKIIHDYEESNWSGFKAINDDKLRESDDAERTAEQERQFIQQRKALIRKKLKHIQMTQQELGKILGHPGKSYISELMNGISPFSLKDLVVIHHLLDIDLKDLVPTILPYAEIAKIRSAVHEFKRSKL